VLEIGFGMGDATAAVAAAQPGTDFIGIEVHPPGVGALLKRIGEQRAVQPAHRAARRGRGAAADGGAGHAGRRARLVSRPLAQEEAPQAAADPAGFVALLASRAGPGGYLHCATDWQPYAEQMLQVLSAEPMLVNTAPGYAPRPDWRPLTKFENRGLRLGHGVWDLVFRRGSSRPADPAAPGRQQHHAAEHDAVPGKAGEVVAGTRSGSASGCTAAR
jgi:tRNA (guanine-N7-)-methyltransferase